MKSQETTLHGMEAVALSNELVRVTVLPELGGKIASLVSVETGREFLLQPQHGHYTPATYGETFEGYDTSGFDECFPTVAACQYPQEPYSQALIPDHGELWSVPWQQESLDGKFSLAVNGSKLPYILRKELSLKSSKLRVEYELQSISPAPLTYIYSAHPLLNVEPGAVIFLPSEITSLLIEGSVGGVLGARGDCCTWPIATVADSATPLNVLTGAALKTAHKLFTRRLTSGVCGIHFPRTREALVYRFDPELLPYIGLWLCQGGWPNTGDGHFTAALEPCTAPTDSLADAFTRGEQRILPPHGLHRWFIEIELLSNCDDLVLES